jgi:hypothetical protein
MIYNRSLLCGFPLRSLRLSGRSVPAKSQSRQVRKVRSQDLHLV